MGLVCLSENGKNEQVQNISLMKAAHISAWSAESTPFITGSKEGNVSGQWDKEKVINYKYLSF